MGPKLFDDLLAKWTNDEQCYPFFVDGTQFAKTMDISVNTAPSSGQSTYTPLTRLDKSYPNGDS